MVLIIISTCMLMTSKYILCVILFYRLRLIKSKHGYWNHLLAKFLLTLPVILLVLSLNHPVILLKISIFDSSLTFETHINSITRSAFFHVRRIAKLCPFISFKDAEMVFHAFVLSCLDYNNALFIGLPASSIARLQYIQNSAARILTNTKHSAHITQWPIVSSTK